MQPHEKTPIISVITPCYNQGVYLDECLKSVYNQTFPNWECIVINAGSTDNTNEIINKWMKIDSRFKTVNSEARLSSAGARNKGLSIAKGSWIQFIDSDDIITKNKFEHSLLYFNSYDIVISKFNYLINNKVKSSKNNFFLHDISYESLILNWDIKYTIPIHCVLFKKELAQDFNEKLNGKEDWLFWIEVFKRSNNYIKTEETSSLYRITKNSKTRNIKLMLSNEEKAYSIIYDEIESEKLKRDFFISRINMKNKKILSHLDHEDSMIELLQKLIILPWIKLKRRIG